MSEVVTNVDVSAVEDIPAAEEAVGSTPTLAEALERVSSKGGTKSLASTSEEPAADSEETPEAVEASAEETEEEQAPAEGGSSLLKKLIDSKYGGDENKFTEAMYQQWNTSAEMHREIKELKQALRAPEPEPLQEVEHPDIPWLNQQISAVDTRVQANATEQQNLLQKMAQISVAIARAEGSAAAAADEFQKEKFEREIGVLQGRYDATNARYINLGEAIERASWDKQELGRRVRTAEGELNVYRQQQQQAAFEDAKFKVLTLETFVKSVDTAASELKLVKDTPERIYLESVVKAELSSYLNSLPPDSPPIDIEKFVSERAEAFAKVLKLSKQAATKTAVAGKLQATSKGPAAPRTAETIAATVTPPKGQWTSAFARQRATRILGG